MIRFMLFSLCLIAGAGMADEPARATDTAGCQTLYEQGRYNEAVDCFSRKAMMMEPLGDAQALVEIYSALGASYVMADKPMLGKAVFGKLLLLSPHFELDPNRFAPDIVAIFQIAKHDYLPKTYSLGYSFLPFGTPQYRNGQKPKALVCGILQALSLGVAIAGYQRMTALHSDRMGYAEENYDEAKTASRLHMVGFTLFLGSYVYGLADGLIFKPREIADVETHRHAD